MEQYLIDALAQAKIALESADPQELLDDFLKFEEFSAGPLVKDMFKEDC